MTLKPSMMAIPAILTFIIVKVRVCVVTCSVDGSTRLQQTSVHCDDAIFVGPVWCCYGSGKQDKTYRAHHERHHAPMNLMLARAHRVSVSQP